MPTVELPDQALEAARRGVLRELVERADDVRAELARLLDDEPTPLAVTDVHDLLASLREMLALQDDIGWPGSAGAGIAGRLDALDDTRDRATAAGAAGEER